MFHSVLYNLIHQRSRNKTEKKCSPMLSKFFLPKDVFYHWNDWDNLENNGSLSKHHISLNRKCSAFKKKLMLKSCYHLENASRIWKFVDLIYKIAYF